MRVVRHEPDRDGSTLVSLEAAPPPGATDLDHVGSLLLFDGIATTRFRLATAAGSRPSP